MLRHNPSDTPNCGHCRLSSSRLRVRSATSIESYDLGVNSYIVKPIEFDKFVETVQTLGALLAALERATGSRCTKRDIGRYR